MHLLWPKCKDHWPWALGHRFLEGLVNQHTYDIDFAQEAIKFHVCESDK